MTIIKAIIAALAALAYSYLGGAFIQGAFDPLLWSMDARFFTLLLGTVGAGSVVFMLIDQGKKQ